MYKDPEQVVNWFYSNDEQLKNIESISLEEQVVDYLFDEANSEILLASRQSVNG